MKNWKDKVLGIFAGIGIMSLLMASNSQTTTPSSHVWEFYIASGTDNSYTRAFSLNKVTGEVRKHETYYGRVTDMNYGEYVVATELE